MVPSSSEGYEPCGSQLWCATPDVFRWKGSVGFVSREMSYAILGTHGFFQFFDLNYSNSRQTIDVTPAGDLPA